MLDQRYRELMNYTFTPWGADSVAALLGMTGPQVVAYLIRVVPETDSSNIRRVSQLIRRYGYPGKTLVGAPTNEAAFYVIQHSNRIAQYLPVVRQAADRGELPFREYAKMLDRQLMNEGKEQVYGTQGQGFSVKNPATGQPGFKQIIWPIKDPSGVNQRRKKAGFDQTVEENARRLGIPYQVLTLEQARRMQRP